MSSDKARVSYDETRQFRSVVMQQGRVTLEADWNEAQQIAMEEERKEALDFVGVSGTPDDGYKVLETGQVPNPAFDFSVSNGTMYVGGERAFLFAPVRYANQTEWLDHSSDPDYADLATLAQSNPTREYIYLLLREQEVSAVEDTALREVALGGPDTAQRTRLVQHVVRLATKADNCADALAAAETRWASQGLTFNENTDFLSSPSTLQVTFPQNQNQPDPCQPQASGGYLGADNQLIRVQVSSAQAGALKLLWGFDDASFLYRVDVLDNQTVKLQSRPVDQPHQPRTGQAVEVLRAVVSLGGTDYVASATGQVFTLTQPYDPDSQQISLPTPLLPDYVDTKKTPVVFLRVWEKEAPFTANAATVLDNTGLAVTLQAPNNIFHTGDSWLIAVRPSTPTTVYPHRYLDGPQLPDGPRMWVCPLAVIEWQKGVLHVLSDCRNLFDNLVELTKRKLGGCCTVNVRPEDLAKKTLQNIIDAFRDQDKIVICLLPGVYELEEPLRLDTSHSNLTLEACHDGAVVKAKANFEGKFIDGLIVLNRANNVTLRGLRLDLPQVPFTASGGKLVGLSAASQKALAAVVADLRVSIGLRAAHCALLAIENCLFRFSITPNADVLGLGIFEASECWGVRVIGNRFVREEDYLRVTERPFRMLIGYGLAPTVITKVVAANPATGAAARAVGVLAPSLLQDGVFERNLFSGVTVPVLAVAEFGTVRIESNTARDCFGGFWLLSTRVLALVGIARLATVDRALLDRAKAVYQALAATNTSPLVQVALTLMVSYPLPGGFDTKAILVPEGGLKATRQANQVNVVFNKLLGAIRAPGGNIKQVADQVNVAKSLPAVKQPRLAAELAHFEPVYARLSDVVRAAVITAEPHGFSLALHCNRNDVQNLISGLPTAYALVVWDDERDTTSNMVMSANLLRCRVSEQPAAQVFLVERCSVTGNLVANEDQGGGSFQLFPSATGKTLAAVVVTGNVFRGFTQLPVRPALNPPAPPPMDSWAFFNAIS